MPKIKDRKLDTKTEKKIITGIIASTKFLETIEPQINYDLFDLPYSGIVINWCLDYYEEFKKAPGIHIQSIFENKFKTIDENIADLLAKFLDQLSTSFENIEEFNEEYLIKEAVTHFNERLLKILNEDIAIHLGNGHPDKAQELLNEYKPIVIEGNLVDKISSSTISEKKLYKKKIRKPRNIIRPWLTAPSLTQIYAKEGVGKTMIAYILAIAMTRENYREIKLFGGWEVKMPVGCLIVDGEMDEGLIRDRLKKLAGPCGKSGKKTPLSIFSASAFLKDHEKEQPPNLGSKIWRSSIMEYTKNNPEYQVIILDNLYSLIKGIDLSDNTEWQAINEWLLELRHNGVSVIMLHHAGKSGDQLGASSRNFNLNNTIYLKTPKGHMIEKDGAVFEVHFEKGRDIKPGDITRFTLRIEDFGHNDWLTWAEE